MLLINTFSVLSLQLKKLRWHNKLLIHLRQRERLSVLEMLYKERIMDSASTGDERDTEGVDRRPETKVLVDIPRYSPKTKYERAISYVIV